MANKILKDKLCMRKVILKGNRNHLILYLFRPLKKKKTHQGPSNGKKRWKCKALTNTYTFFIWSVKINSQWVEDGKKIPVREHGDAEKM